MRKAFPALSSFSNGIDSFAVVFHDDEGPGGYLAFTPLDGTLPGNAVLVAPPSKAERLRPSLSACSPQLD